MPPSEPPAPPAVTPADPGPTTPSGAPLSRRTALLVVAVVAVVVAVVVVAIGLLGGDDEPGGAATAQQTRPATRRATDRIRVRVGSGSGSGQGDDTETAVPEGFRLVRDPLDFTVAVPKGWERRLDGETRVDFVSPDGSRFLRVDQVAQAGADAEQAWLDAEPSVAESLPGYSRIRIEPVDYDGREAADWEFTWEGDNGTVHVLNRGFVTEPRGFALYMSGPEDTWESESLPVFETAADTFRPSA